MSKLKIIQVKGIAVAIYKVQNQDYISLTDIARNKNPDEPKDVVKNYMRSKIAIEFLGFWNN
jgi:hypothetical protein